MVKAYSLNHLGEGGGRIKFVGLWKAMELFQDDPCPFRKKVFHVDF